MSCPRDKHEASAPVHILNPVRNEKLLLITITTNELLRPASACELNMNDPAATTKTWHCETSDNIAHYEPLMRRPFREMYDPSSGGGNSTPYLNISQWEARLCLIIWHLLIPIFEVPP
ncbi:hypothetical protein AVEN_119034-1 [Araneus ventricosus]|uniref:Uncharacterized protein n=1 Tax=Araneus ventricosus TaxID=182803 RepID=A0A4Y2FCU3_ARAVE|nr:hypothetical protein AVEN_119034-1 [Araneus ventricosus]